MMEEKGFHFAKLEWRLFLFLLITYAFFFNEHPGSNANTRMDLIYSIVDQGVLNIDLHCKTFSYKEEYFTQDVAYYKGHYYTDKSPITSFLGVPVYFSLKQLSDLFLIQLYPDFSRYWVTLFVISLPSAFLAIFLFRFMGFIRPDAQDQLIVTLVYSLGTIAFPYSILFFSHQLTAALVFIGFYYLYNLFNKNNTGVLQWNSLFFAGFLVGLGFAAEQPAGIILVGISLFLLYGLKRKVQAFWFFVGVGIAFLIPLYYYYKCFGNPFTPGYTYEMVPMFKEDMGKGFMGMTYPTWQTFWGITLSPYRGLFFQSPVLLLSIPGFYFMMRSKKIRPLGILCVFIVGGFFYFNSSLNNWHGGWAAGPRYLAPMIPFLIIPLYIAIPRFKRAIIFTGILSIIYLSFICITEPQMPASGVLFVEFILPRFIHYNFTQNMLTFLLNISRPWAVFLWGLYLITGIIFLFQFSSKEHSRKDLIAN